MKNTSFIIIIILMAIIGVLIFKNGCFKPPPSHDLEKKAKDSLMVAIGKAELKSKADSTRFADSISNLQVIIDRQETERYQIKNKLADANVKANRAIEKYNQHKAAGDTPNIIKDCEEMLAQFENFRSLSNEESKKADSIILTLKKVIGNKDAIIEGQANFNAELRIALKDVSDKYDNLFKDYQKTSKVKRFGIGPQIGYGLTSQKAALYVGIGIHYDLIKF